MEPYLESPFSIPIPFRIVHIFFFPAAFACQVSQWGSLICLKVMFVSVNDMGLISFFYNWTSSFSQHELVKDAVFPTVCMFEISVQHELSVVKGIHVLVFHFFITLFHIFVFVMGPCCIYHCNFVR